MVSSTSGLLIPMNLFLQTLETLVLFCAESVGLTFLTGSCFHSLCQQAMETLGLF